MASVCWGWVFRRRGLLMGPPPGAFLAGVLLAFFSLGLEIRYNLTLVIHPYCVVAPKLLLPQSEEFLAVGRSEHGAIYGRR